MIVGVHYVEDAVWELRLADDERSCELWSRRVSTGDESAVTLGWHKCAAAPYGHPSLNYGMISPTTYRIVESLTARVHDALFELRAN